MELLAECLDFLYDCLTLSLHLPAGMTAEQWAPCQPQQTCPACTGVLAEIQPIALPRSSSKAKFLSNRSSLRNASLQNLTFRAAFLPSKWPEPAFEGRRAPNDRHVEGGAPPDDISHVSLSLARSLAADLCNFLPPKAKGLSNAETGHAHAHMAQTRLR